MTKNPFIGPKAPWIKAYVKSPYAPSSRDRRRHKGYTCVSCAKDPYKVAHQISFYNSLGGIWITIDGYDYDFYHHKEYIFGREYRILEHLEHCLELHQAFYDDNSI